MRKLSHLLLTGLLALPLTSVAQYVGKVDKGKLQKPVLRATAVYEYIGSLVKPTAARLVPVVVWDGSSYQPGGLYLAQPEPLTVAPGTQYLLQKSGMPHGYFNVASAAKLNNAWIAMGRYAAPPPQAAPPKLIASKHLPVITGGSGKGKAGADEAATRPTLKNKTAGPPNTTAQPTSGEPTLHRRDQDSTQGSDSTDQPSLHRRDQATTQDSKGASSPDTTDQPTLHRRDSAGANAGNDSNNNAPAPDPDRPRLTPDTPTQAPLPSPNVSSPARSSADTDRPTLHKRSENAATPSAAEYDRPHLRYGVNGDTEKPVLPTELKTMPTAGIAGSSPAADVHQVVAISDAAEDESHPYQHTFASPTDQRTAEQAMQALARQALAGTGRATFGPAAKQNAKLEKSADVGFGPQAHRGTRSARSRQAASTMASDQLANTQFHAFELSYGGGATYVYSAQIGKPGPDRRYVTVIAQPDFYGKLKAVFTQTTSAPMLGQTPALHLIDAVDTDGDHRAELLFDEQTTDSSLNPSGQPAQARRFAIYRVLGGTAQQVYATTPGAIQ